jgi:8-oxo-dGTP diphosphatase
MRDSGSTQHQGRPRPTVAVGAIAVRDRALLMVRRAREPARHLWTVPGGHVEAGEYLADAVRREVNEETGLDVAVGNLVGIFEVLGNPHFVVLDFFAEVTGEGPPAAGTDVSEVRWVPLSKVAELECTPRLVETLRAWGVLPSADDQSNEGGRASADDQSNEGGSPSGARLEQRRAPPSADEQSN